MISYPRYQTILAQSDASVRQAAEQAFQALLAKIRAGEKPRPALDAVLNDFNADAIAGFREALNSLLQSSLGTAEIKAYPVGKVNLSEALYANAQSVSALSQQIIEQHLQGVHDAREMRKALYEGYNVQDDPLKVVKPLPKYLKAEFDQAKAAALKTPALRAAYLDAIRAAEAGAGTAELEKKLQVAFYERNRYTANRIARTELHRNYTDQVAREIMADDQMEYVQIRLSSKHPKADICDYHANLDAYGLGPGIYPKADAPKPPFHPHCYCLMAPRIDLFPKTPPSFNPKAEAAYLRSLPVAEARQVAGSAEKLTQALQGQATLEEIYNQGTDPLYQWQRLGDILPATGAANAPATEADAAMSNAYEAAKAGGKHQDWYKQQLDLGYRQLQKGIRSFEKQIKDHEAWMNDPQSKVNDWASRDIRYREGLIKKWQQDIARHKEQIEILKGVLKETGYGE